VRLVAQVKADHRIVVQVAMRERLPVANPGLFGIDSGVPERLVQVVDERWPGSAAAMIVQDDFM
jgi:hypothetical protein